MIPSDAFPNLNERNHQVTSPADVGYNCIAWSAADTQHWWQPGIFWPVKTPRDNHGIAALEEAFKTLGYDVGCVTPITRDVDFIPSRDRHSRRVHRLVRPCLDLR